MKIVQLSAENIKRLKAINIKPDGSIVQITGKNGQGKTSVLDCISYGLEGKDALPPKPVRDGEDDGWVSIDLGEDLEHVDYVVNRKIGSDGKVYLSVESKEGAKFPSPQKLLDSLTGDLTFDPLAFTRLSPKEQLVTLKKVAGLDFDQLDEDRKSFFEQRTEIGRMTKTAEAQLNALPLVKDLPSKPIDLDGLMATQEQMQKQDRDNCALRSELENVKNTKSNLEKQLKDITKRFNTLNEQVSKLEDPDLESVKKQIVEAQEINIKLSKSESRKALAKKVREYSTEYDKLTEQINSIDQQKADNIKNAKLPIDGLTIDENGVILNDVPFEQLSSAEQLKISVAMGIAINPKLRIMLVRDGSLLDEDSMKMMGEMAETNNMQIWIERVGSDESVGIFIEDGSVK